MSEKCGKRRYLTQQYAQFNVFRMKQDKLPGASKLTEYRCKRCGFWHVGNKRRRVAA